MKLSSGVEWACHACAILAALPPDKGLRADALAAYHDLPPAYMAKQLQALSKAGLVMSNRGAHGGYRLAKTADEISLWDITAAIEGPTPVFQCTEIRQNGPCRQTPQECRAPCPIAHAFHQADAAFRESLKNVPLTVICADVAQDISPAKVTKFGKWLTQEMTDVTSAMQKEKS